MSKLYGVPDRPRVLVNLCWLVPGVVGGSEESTTDAIRALLDLTPPDIELSDGAPLDGESPDIGSSDIDLPHIDLELAVLESFLGAHPDLADRVKCHVAPFGAGNKALRILVEHTWLAGLAARRKVDLVHHAGGVIPFVHPRKLALTIHDLQPLDHPENFSLFKRSYLSAMIGRSARCADVVCVPSTFTADRVTALLGVEAERIVHVPWTVPQRAAAVPLDAASDLYTGWSADRKFVLYPSVTYPHKRHLLLLAAFSRLAEVHPEVDLVLTGGAAQMEQQVMDEVARSGLSERVKRLGRVPLDALQQLYGAASMVAIPSSYEGFGLPALEAMSYGTVVIASRSGSLGELLPDVWTVEGDDPDIWAAAMSAVMQMSGTDRNQRIARGLQIASEFDPRRTAAALLDAYRLALERPARKA